MSDNDTQFTSGDFKEFMEDFQVDHITTPTYRPRSNGQAKRFMDTLMRALKKAKDTQSGKALQQFLQVYRIMPNEITPSQMSPAKVIFTRKIQSVFDKLLPKQVKPAKTTVPKKKYMLGEKIFFQMHKDNKTFWEQGTIKNRIGCMVYMVEGPHATHKKHLNQIRKCTSDKSSETLPEEMYDAFNLEPPQTSTEIHHSG